MRLSKNTLNNMMMDNQRRSPLYQTIITDLAITDNIDREDAEMLLGYKIPAFLKTPDGQHLDDAVETKEEKPATKADNKKEEKPAVKTNKE